MENESDQRQFGRRPCRGPPPEHPYTERLAIIIDTSIYAINCVLMQLGLACKMYNTPIFVYTPGIHT